MGYDKDMWEKTIIEWCPHCETEVEIPAHLCITQTCPNCGKEILPCSLCNNDIVNCRECGEGICQKWKMPNTTCCMRDASTCMMCDHFKLCPYYKGE